MRDDLDNLRERLVTLVGEQGIPTPMVAVKRLTNLVNAHRNEWRESKGLPPMAE